jgi:hypothetical protein
VVAAVAAAAVLAVPACSGGDDEPSFGELVSDLEGEELSQGEVARRRDLARFLCSLEGPLLHEVWERLTPRQLEFQDVVFRVECPERLEEYAVATGRFAVDGS